MSPICIMLAILTVAFAFGCITLRRKNKAFEGMLCKFMASFGFVSIAVVGYGMNPANTYYFVLICFALMFGFCGDILLGIKEVAPTFKGQLVPLGTLYFLVSHIFCLCAFIETSSFNVVALIIGIFGIGLAAVLMKAFKMKIDGKLKIVMAVYYGTLIYKAAAAGVFAITMKNPASIVAFAGSILFLVSDTCLGMLYFTPVKRKNVWVTVELSTYYPAQIFLATSVALMK